MIDINTVNREAPMDLLPIGQVFGMVFLEQARSYLGMNF